MCPVCKAVIDAEVSIRDNRVVMRKRCREHVDSETVGQPAGVQGPAGRRRSFCHADDADPALVPLALLGLPAPFRRPA